MQNSAPMQKPIQTSCWGCEVIYVSSIVAGKTATGPPVAARPVTLQSGQVAAHPHRSFLPCSRFPMPPVQHQADPHRDEKRESVVHEHVDAVVRGQKRSTMKSQSSRAAIAVHATPTIT